MRTFVFLAVFVAAVSVGAYHTGRMVATTNKGLAQAKSGLTVSGEHLDIGNVPLSADFVHGLTVRNLGRATVAVDEIRTSCGCTKVEPSSFSLNPGASIKLNVSIDLSPHRPELSAAFDRPFSVVLTPVVHSATEEPIQWQVHGTVRQPYRFATTHLAFHDLIHGHPYKCRAIDLICREPIGDLSATCEPPFVDVRIQPNDDDPLRFRLLLSPKSTLPLGRRECMVSLTGTDNKGHRLPALQHTIHLEVLPGVKVIPVFLSLDCNAAEKPSANAELMLRSVGSGPFSVVDASVENIIGDIAVELDARGPTARVSQIQYRLSATPHNIGINMAKTTFRVEDKQSGTYSLRSLLSCNRTDPAAHRNQ